MLGRAVRTIRHALRPRSGTGRFSPVPLLLVLLLTGCYTVRPLPSPQPEPGTRVRAQLTTEGATELEPMIGSQVVRVEGIIGEARQNEWQLFMLSVEQANGQEVFWNRESIVFPRAAIAIAEERRLDRTRSFLLAGGITAGAILMGRLVAGAASGNGGGTDPPPPVEYRGPR